MKKQTSTPPYTREPCPLIATDVIIEYATEEKNGIVLIERKNPPHGIALVGGFAIEGLSYEDNAIKEGGEESSLDVRLLHPERPLIVKSTPNRDPRGHITTIVYLGEGTGVLRANDDAKNAYHATLDEVATLVANHYAWRKKEREQPVFAFDDHADILHEYLAWKNNQELHDVWRVMMDAYKIDG